jgi:hypothetical protein
VSLAPPAADGLVVVVLLLLLPVLPALALAVLPDCAASRCCLASCGLPAHLSSWISCARAG